MVAEVRRGLMNMCHAARPQTSPTQTLSAKSLPPIGLLVAIPLVFLLWQPLGCRRTAESSNGRTKVSIGIQVSPAMTLLMVAQDKGFFEQQGLDVQLKQFTAGKFALQAFFANAIDYAVSGDVPVCLAALGGNQSRVVAQVVARTIDEVRVVARKDNALKSSSDPANYFRAKKRKLATSFGGGPEFFTYNFLLHNGIASNQIELLSQRPEDMPASLVSKSLDAISIFDPYAFIAEKQLGPQGVTYRGSNLYSELYILVAHPKQLEQDAATIEALLRAMRQAEDYTAAHPDEAKQILQKYTKLDPDVINGIWNSFDFKITLTPELLAYWNAEAKWAKATAKVTPQTAIPDFSSYIEPRFLQAVSPESVRLH
jgi:ABC-type nitrate/sulfonate/bicarbonate transport system substrate-binding protein